MSGGKKGPDSVEPGSERRSFERHAIEWSVDCVTDDTFLYAAITNISEMGIFVRCNEPFLVGTLLSLRFAPNDGHEPFVLPGRVQWVNPYRPECRNPGMGIRFLNLSDDDRERIVDVIHTIAYVRDPSN